jgi:hypothetical protein
MPRAMPVGQSGRERGVGRARLAGGGEPGALFPGGVSAAHREHVTTWWCEVFGGAAEYTERLGGRREGAGWGVAPPYQP